MITLGKNMNQYEGFSSLVGRAHFPNMQRNCCVCVNELWITGFKQVTTDWLHGNEKNTLWCMPDFCPDLWVTACNYATKYGCPKYALCFLVYFYHCIRCWWIQTWKVSVLTIFRMMKNTELSVFMIILIILSMCAHVYI